MLAKAGRKRAVEVEVCLIEEEKIHGFSSQTNGRVDAIVDLELIADYAYEIVTLSVSMKRRPPSQISNQVSELGARIRATLTTAIESWREGNREQALSVRPLEGSIRAECGTLYEKLSRSFRRLARVRCMWI
jgi:phosphate uptake regulator